LTLSVFAQAHLSAETSVTLKKPAAFLENLHFGVDHSDFFDCQFNTSDSNPCSGDYWKFTLRRLFTIRKFDTKK